MNRVYILLISLLAGLSTQAQQRIIRGLVTDDKALPLAGVSVHLQNPPITTLSGVDGRFTWTGTPRSVTLTAHAIGYVSQKIVLKIGVDSLTIRLQPDLRTLDEVVITGYGTSARKDMRGSIGTISSAPIRSASSSRRAAEIPNRTSASGMTTTRFVATNVPVLAGQLTSGEIYDYSKWTLWQDITAGELKEYKAHWHQAPAERYSVQLVTPDGFPVIDVPVRLLDSQRQVIWQTRTDNTGRSELWANLFRLEGDLTVATKGKLTVEASVAGQTYMLNRPHSFGKGNNSINIGQPCQGAPSMIDIAFVVDATGSMGDEITYLKAELTDVINQAKLADPNNTIRLGSVFYRDKTDDYLTRHRDFSDQPDSTIAFIRQQEAGGGGDYPEAVDTALAVALNQLSWSKAAKTRLLFLVLDAPPHDDDQSKASLQRSVAKAAEMGIRIIPIAASGINKGTEYLLRSMALGTNGSYVFLTDDSGIGNSHIKPTTDQYTVEKFNELLVRLIAKFSQTPDCRPQVGLATQVRYTEQGRPIDTTAQPNRASPESRFRYFPNPTRDYLTIESQDTIRELFVLDITGKVLQRQQPNQVTVRLDMLPYPTGTYLFRFEAAQTWQTGCFLLNR